MKIFVGLSGGVDSAISAALLKEQGHDVTGVFIRIYRPEFIECTWKEDRLDAMRVCVALSIPFCEVDLSDEYKKEVVDRMIGEYQNGITPNPDVQCNRAIKFGAFLKWARKRGAEKIATGHYARLQENKDGYELLRGADANKDQSYFLYRLMQDDLRHALFPVGEMQKPDVREHARRINLPVAGKRDSQGLCFIGDVPIADFLQRFIDVKPGPVVDKSGRVIGEHEGAALLTIGQRHGFSLAKEVESVPHYVVSIDAQANTIIVSPRKEDAAVKSVTLRDTNWISSVPEDGIDVLVQARYREAPVAARMFAGGKHPRIEFDKPHIAAAGQSLVAYGDDVCLGGGIIEKTG